MWPRSRLWKDQLPRLRRQPPREFLHVRPDGDRGSRQLRCGLRRRRRTQNHAGAAALDRARMFRRMPGSTRQQPASSSHDETRPNAVCRHSIGANRAIPEMARGPRRLAGPPQPPTAGKCQLRDLRIDSSSPLVSSHRRDARLQPSALHVAARVGCRGCLPECKLLVKNNATKRVTAHHFPGASA